ncbi:unnamed protein product [Rotaria sp. Silwood2]|nr:unnamed protein product [Rotaria sp. Silwood2]
MEFKFDDESSSELVLIRCKKISNWSLSSLIRAPRAASRAIRAELELLVKVKNIECSTMLFWDMVQIYSLIHDLTLIL